MGFLEKVNPRSRNFVWKKNDQRTYFDENVGYGSSEGITSMTLMSRWRDGISEGFNKEEIARFAFNVYHESREWALGRSYKLILANFTSKSSPLSS